MGFPNSKSFFTLLDEAKQSKEVIRTKKLTLGLDGEFVLALVACNDNLLLDNSRDDYLRAIKEYANPAEELKADEKKNSQALLAIRRWFII